MACLNTYIYYVVCGRRIFHFFIFAAGNEIGWVGFEAACGCATHTMVLARGESDDRQTASHGFA